MDEVLTTIVLMVSTLFLLTVCLKNGAGRGRRLAPGGAFGIFDAPTGGNLVYWNTLTAPKTIQLGDFGQFAPGSLVVEED